MEWEATAGSNRARFEGLEENQKEIMAALVEMKAAINQLSLNTTERRERMERRSVEHDGKRRRDGQSNNSGPTRRHADERHVSHGDSNLERSRYEEEPEWDERRRGGRVEGKGIAVEKWLDNSAYLWDSYHRCRQNDWDSEEEDNEASDDGRPLCRRRAVGHGHHYGPRRRHGWCGNRDGHDRREGSYHDQKPRKPKIDFPCFDGGDPHEWLDKAQHYFHVYEVPRDKRVDVACFFMDGKASKW